MSQVNIEKPPREAVTPQFVESLQKIGFVSMADMPQRSLQERLQLFNPFDDAYRERVQEQYETAADSNRLFVAVTNRLGKDEMVGFALVDKPSSNEGQGTEAALTRCAVSQFAVLPCATFNTNEVSGLLISAIRGEVGPEQSIAVTVFDEQVLALRSLLMHGFKHDTSNPDLMLDYFGQGTLPAIRHTLVLPGISYSSAQTT